MSIDWSAWIESIDSQLHTVLSQSQSHPKLIKELQEQVAKLEVRVCELEDGEPDESDYRCQAYTKDTYGHQSQCEGTEGHDGSHWHGATLWPNN